MSSAGSTTLYALAHEIQPVAILPTIYPTDGAMPVTWPGGVFVLQHVAGHTNVTLPWIVTPTNGNNFSVALKPNGNTFNTITIHQSDGTTHIGQIDSHEMCRFVYSSVLGMWIKTAIPYASLPPVA